MDDLFGKISTFVVAQQQHPESDTDIETVAEIVDASEDGTILVYSDAALGAVGFVDIRDPGNPTPLGTVDVGGEPTSVAVAGPYVLASINTSVDFINTSGTLLVIDIATRAIVREIDLGGQPDSIAVSPDGLYAAVAIENERDEDLGNGDIIDTPQPPPGFLQVIDLDSWTATRVDLSEATLAAAGIAAPSDPEPEYVDINEDNIAVVTLQENNGIVLIDLAAKSVVGAFSAGTVDLDNIDATEDRLIDQSESLASVPREPDGVAWIDSNHFAISNEGDMRGGSRGFSIFDITGTLIFDSGNELELRAASLGHYPEERSENKGNEPENIEFAEFGGEKLLFVNSERANLVFVYNVDDLANPLFKQALPTGVGPEGAKAIPARNLLVVASEVDERENAIRSSLSLFALGEGAAYPTLQSEIPASGTPIPWTALSGLSAGGAGKLFSVQDSFLQQSKFFTIDTSGAVPTITRATSVVDSDGILAAFPPQGEFSAADLAALINPDNSVNLDFEGIVFDGEDHVFIVSEGRGTAGDSSRPVESLNFLLQVQVDTGVIKGVHTLPAELNQNQFRFGFEGVALLDGKLYVATQRAWAGDADPRIHVFDQASGNYEKSLFYPLDPVESVNGGWVGLGGLSSIDDGSGELLVIERDNQGGPDAAVKRLYRINPAGLENGDTLEKELALDLISVLEQATNSPVDDKIEGVAFTQDGVWIVNDNDGTDDSNGETTLINLGSAWLPERETGTDVFRFYNQAIGEHLLSATAAEVLALESSFDPLTGSGWRNDGIVFRSYEGAGSEEARRYVNPEIGRHLVTLNAFEQSVLEASGDWVLEGTAFGASATQIVGVADTAVERFHNPFTNAHIYSADAAEIALLSADTAWNAEGVAFYV